MTPPHDLEAEEAVLGSILLDGNPAPALIDAGLRPEHFYRPQLGAIFSAVVALNDRGEPIDRLTLTAESKRLRTGATVAQIDLLHAAPPVVGHLAAYARTVVDMARLRRKQEAAHRILAAIDARDERALSAAEDELEDNVTAVGFLSAEDFGARTLEAIRSPDGRAQWSWGFAHLDKLTGGGMRRSQMTIIGAWPKVGKSVLTDGILCSAARGGAKAHLYVNEMSAEERGQRLAARLCEIDYGRIQEGKVSETESGRLEEALRRLPFGITTCAGTPAKDVSRDMLRRGWDVAAVDILHEFDYEGESELRAMASLFARTAKQAASHILATVHFNEKRAEDGEYPRPVPRDILGSGHMKRAADFVMFVHREQDPDGIFDDEGMVWFALGRSSKQGGQRVRFRGEYQRFEPW